MEEHSSYRLTQQVRIHGWSCKLGESNLETLLQRTGLKGDIEAMLSEPDMKVKQAAINLLKRL